MLGGISGALRIRSPRRQVCETHNTPHTTHHTRVTVLHIFVFWVGNRKKSSRPNPKRKKTQGGISGRAFSRFVVVPTRKRALCPNSMCGVWCVCCVFTTNEVMKMTKGISIRDAVVKIDKVLRITEGDNQNVPLSMKMFKNHLIPLGGNL